MPDELGLVMAKEAFGSMLAAATVASVRSSPRSRTLVVTLEPDYPPSRFGEDMDKTDQMRPLSPSRPLAWAICHIADAWPVEHCRMVGSSSLDGLDDSVAVRLEVGTRDFERAVWVTLGVDFADEAAEVGSKGR